MELIQILIALLAALPGVGALYIQLRRSKADIMTVEADTSAKFEKIARDAAQSIIDKSLRIQLLENGMIVLQNEINVLQKEKQLLACENDKLETRVKKLEGILLAYNIPYPKKEGDQ
jgi:hypothetical protein